MAAGRFGVQHQLIDGDRFIVAACDGLWDVFTSQQVVDIVHQFLFEDDNSPEVCHSVCACALLASMSVA